jgi:hypothetical protein
MYAFGVFSGMLLDTALRRTGSVHAYDIGRGDKQLAWAHFSSLIDDMRFIRDHGAARRTQPSDSDRRVRMHVQRCLNAKVTAHADVLAHVTAHENKAPLSRAALGYIRVATSAVPYVVASSAAQLVRSLQGHTRTVVMYTRPNVPGHAVALSHMNSFADHFPDVMFVVAMVDQIGKRDAAHTDELPVAVFTSHGVQVNTVANYGAENWTAMNTFTQHKPYKEVFSAEQFEKKRGVGFTGVLFRTAETEIPPAIEACFEKAAHKYGWVATLIMAYTDKMTDTDNTKCDIKPIVESRVPTLVVYKGTSPIISEQNISNMYALCEKYIGSPHQATEIAKPAFLAARLRSV